MKRTTTNLNPNNYTDEALRQLNSLIIDELNRRKNIKNSQVIAELKVGDIVYFTHCSNKASHLYGRELRIIKINRTKIQLEIADKKDLTIWQCTASMVTKDKSKIEGLKDLSIWDGHSLR